jgi:protein O-mannosyl-transferase
MNPKPLSARTCFLLILLFGIAAYSNTFTGPFQFDDMPRIVENHSLRPPFSLAKIWKSFPTRVVANLSFALQYAFTGLKPWGFHCVNLLIHLLTAMVIVAIVRKLLRTPALLETVPPSQHDVFALVPALLFLTHPIQTQSVTYIVQRMTSLAALFYLATIWMYLKARLENARYYRSVFLFMLAAMLTKEISFTLPFAILLTDICFFPVSASERLSRKIWRWMPFAAFLLVIPLIYMVSSEQLIDNLPTTNSKTYRWDYLLTQFRVIRTYLRLLFFPVNQCLNYDFRLSSGWGDPDTWSAFALLLGTLALAIALFKKHRLLSFGILWFFLTLSAESSFFPIADVIFEHRLYLPMFGFVLFLTSLLWRVCRSVKLFTAVSLVIIVIFSSMTYVRNEVWKSKLSLAQDAVRKSPRLGIAYAGLADAYNQELGDPRTAVIYYEKALKLGFATPSVYHYLSQAYARIGDQEKSIHFQKLFSSSSVYVKNLSLYLDHAFALMSEGKNSEAVEILKKAIQISPESSSLYIRLGEAYFKMQRDDEAISSFRKAIDLAPLSRNGYDALALLYQENGSEQKALAVLMEYLKYKERHKPLFGD